MANATMTPTAKKSGWAPAQMGKKRMGCPGSSWRPNGASMGKMNAEDRQVMGIAILSALSIAGLHSAICPSYFTQRTFASQPEDKEFAMEGLLIALVVYSLATGDLFFVFDSWLPALVPEVTILAPFA